MASRVSSRISASVTSDTELRICCCSLSARAMGTACGRAGVLCSALIHTKTGAHREDVAQHAGDRFGSPITRRPDAAALSDGADSPPVSIPVLRMPPRKPQMTRRTRWARLIVSICNIYRANLPLRVTDRDKRSTQFTNVSICNSYRVKSALIVIDQDRGGFPSSPNQISQSSCNFEHVAYNVALVTLFIAQPFNTSPTGGH